MGFLELPFMRTAFIVSLLIGNALALLGLFISMRRISFAGLAASQLAALGAVVGILLGHFGAFGAALLLVGAGLMLLARLSRITRTPQESWVACLYILGAGLAVLILAKAPLGEAHTLNIFFGNVLTLGREEVVEALVVLALTLALLGPWLHRYIWISFDPLMAEVAGLRVNWWNFLFFLIFALAMTFSIHMVGVLLAFAYLLLPAACALLATRRLGTLLATIPLITIGGTWAGFQSSFRWDYPTGPFVATFLAGATLLLGLFRIKKTR